MDNKRLEKVLGERAGVSSASSRLLNCHQLHSMPNNHRSRERKCSDTNFIGTATSFSAIVATAVNHRIGAAMDEWFCHLQTTPENVIQLIPSSSAPPSELYALVLPPQKVSAIPSVQPFSSSTAYIAPHARFIHSTFEVGESSTHSNPNVQASSRIAQQQLEGLQQHITAIEAILGTTFNTHDVF
ncbi:uncharacterized protein E5676_scaffold325G001380 [Cucumis melo var. makuwa]|uniref:Kirola-like n=1 Tax=Cucumis melo var. makuwa TaxID=1194695 RepID=A0A5D3DUR5_CUCMM|nr:uncharacterized protein E6C27_scaffold130G00200 [Cucumis melo var. makuwa]TYK27441.1 uncharacterized protein E5676_scaffold325G001380 [Cucumis melo var. makuwa]